MIVERAATQPVPELLVRGPVSEPIALTVNGQTYAIDTATRYAAAIANAVFHATGRRFRALPITPELVMDP
jgi:hypothetical protein